MLVNLFACVAKFVHGSSVEESEAHVNIALSGGVEAKYSRSVISGSRCIRDMLRKIQPHNGDVCELDLSKLSICTGMREDGSAKSDTRTLLPGKHELDVVLGTATEECMLEDQTAESVRNILLLAWQLDLIGKSRSSLCRRLARAWVMAGDSPRLGLSINRFSDPLHWAALNEFKGEIFEEVFRDMGGALVVFSGKEIHAVPCRGGKIGTSSRGIPKDRCVPRRLTVKIPAGDGQGMWIGCVWRSITCFYPCVGNLCIISEDPDACLRADDLRCIFGLGGLESLALCVEIQDGALRDALEGSERYAVKSLELVGVDPGRKDLNAISLLKVESLRIVLVAGEGGDVLGSVFADDALRQNLRTLCIADPRDALSAQYLNAIAGLDALEELEILESVEEDSIARMLRSRNVRNSIRRLRLRVRCSTLSDLDEALIAEEGLRELSITVDCARSAESLLRRGAARGMNRTLRILEIVGTKYVFLESSVPMFEVLEELRLVGSQGIVMCDLGGVFSKGVCETLETLRLERYDMCMGCTLECVAGLERLRELHIVECRMEENTLRRAIGGTGGTLRKLVLVGGGANRVLGRDDVACILEMKGLEEVEVRNYHMDLREALDICAWADSEGTSASVSVRATLKKRESGISRAEQREIRGLGACIEDSFFAFRNDMRPVGSDAF